MIWQLIDTAPRDGARILIWDASGGVAIVYWHNGKSRWRIDCWDDGGYGADLKPTHWMPLPVGPREREEV
jgi:hypothetical protein